MTVTRRQYDIIKAMYILILLVATPAAMVWGGYIQNRLTEMLLSMAAFLVLRNLYEDKYHVGSKIRCSALAVLIFNLMNRAALPISVSLLCAPVMALLLAYGSSHLAELKARPKKIPFKCETATPEEFRERGIRRGLKDEDIEFLIKAHRTRGYRKVLAAEMGIEENSVKDRKRRLTVIIEK